ncbi:MAG: hypothetical protein HUK11_09465 [Muribaculaceae bacterium]|nr:hypothetical protein [Muribaculaceae bacterium]
MKDIAIYGAGGFGREVYCLIKKINDAAQEPRWNTFIFQRKLRLFKSLEYNK